jgi:hypothetical protein
MGEVSCILQLIIDSRAKKNNESVIYDNHLALFSDINGDDEKDSSLKQKSQLYTTDKNKIVENYAVTAAYVLFDKLKFQKKGYN